MEYYFDSDDKLDRLGYARFLESLIRESHLISQKDNGGSFVIALNASWGTGKTRFSIMFKNFLLNRIRNPLLEPREINEVILKYNVIYYNSWDTDFWADALDPILQKIVSEETFQLDEDDGDLEELKKAAIALLKGTGYAFLKHIIGDSAVSIIKDGVEAAFNPKTDPLKAFKEKESQIQLFKEKLSGVIKKSGKKMVVIVDELDRCKPTFAIQTLEFVKHLFDIKDVIFIFALDIPQLSCAAKVVYGTDMDTSGYLCRFFDYIGKLPAPNVKSFTTVRLNEQRFYRRIKEINIEDKLFEQKIVDFIVSMTEIFSLSLRDLDSILSAYQIVTRVFLKTYLDAYAHMIYLFLLTLKSKDVCQYGRLFSENSKPKEIYSEITRNYDISQLDFIQTWLKSISSEAAICEACLPIYAWDEAVNMRDVRIKGISEETEQNTKILYSYADEESSSGKKHYIDSNKFNFGRVLFYDDLIKWDQIRELKFNEYYYQQLEMFNFALTADEQETDA